VASLTDLQQVNAAIDRWLKPICLTGFKEPIEEVEALVQRVGKKRPGSVFSLFFMSDGMDNQWNRADILRVTEKTAGGLSSATFVEYGYYADRPLLTAMAQKAGGTLIFAEDFDRYAPTFEAALGKTVSGAPRVEVPITGDAIGGFAFNGDGTDLYSFEVDAGKITIPKDTAEVVYLSPTPEGKEDKAVGAIAKTAAKRKSHKPEPVLDAAYAAVSLFALRMKPDVVYPILKALGDVWFIEKFAGCFGKQKYTEFMDKAKEASFDEGRFESGWDPKRVPKDDAFTVLDLLQALAEDDGNSLLLDSSDFKYKRIGRGQVDPSVRRREELEEQIAAGPCLTKLKELKEELAALKKITPLKFVADPEPNGYPVSSLTFNESRPNVSVLVRKEGTVKLKPPKEHKRIPKTFPTYIHRNYAVIKDGIINVDRLPVRMTKGTIQKLQKAGMPAAVLRNPKGETLTQNRLKLSKASKGRPVNVVLDLRKLPVINRQMVKDASARTMFAKTHEMMQAKAAQKVYNSVKKEAFPRESKGYKLLYGDEAAAWLKEQGITDYNGFNPKTVQAEASDYYMGKELKVSLKGLSSLPALKAVKAKIASGKKLTASMSLMAPHVEEVEDFLASDAYKKARDQKKVLEAWLDGQLLAARGDARRLMFELAQIKFSVVVGQIWFTEFTSLDENSLDLDIGDGQTLACKVDMKETKVLI
jgi:hypothetical protein